MYKTIVKKLQKSIKDTLRTFQPGICKNLRTSQPQKKITGPYKKKRVYIGLLKMNNLRKVHISLRAIIAPFYHLVA